MPTLAKIIAVLAALAIIGGGAYLALRKITGIPSDSGSATSSATFEYAKGNFEIGLPAGWSEATTSVAGPHGISGVQFTLVNSSSSCAVAYAHAPISEFQIPPLAQVSFGDRVFTSQDEQTDSDWWVQRSEAPADLVFSDHARRALPGEMKMLLIPSDYASPDIRHEFVLYNPSGGTVSDACSEDLNAMIRTFRWSYQMASLDSGSSGAIRLRRIPKDGIGALFIGADGIAKEISVVDGASTNFSVYRDKIYSMRGDQLYQYDPFSKEETAVPGAKAPEGYIIDYLLADGRVYFLSASDNICVGGGRCTTALYDAPIGSPAVKRADMQASTIVGYDVAEKAIYTQEGYGDAGCFSAEYEKYSYATNATSSAGDVGGCEGEPGDDAAIAKVNSFTARFADEIAQVGKVGVQNGHLTKSAIDDALPGDIPLRFMGR